MADDCEHKLERRKAAWVTLCYPRASDCAQRLAHDLTRIGCAVEPRGDKVIERDGLSESRYLVRWKEPFDVNAVAPSFSTLGLASGAASVQWEIID